MTRPIRVAWLASHPVQYQAPLFRRIAADSAVELEVLFLSDMSVAGYRDPGFGVRVQWDIDLLSGYQYRFLRAFGDRSHLSFWRPATYGVTRQLRSGGYAVLVLHGYYHQANLQALAAARRLGIPVLLRGESHLQSESRSSVKLRFKAALAPRFFSQFSGFLAIGSMNRAYYLYYGVPEDRIFSMPYAVDNDFFASRAAAAGQLREDLRRELRLERGRPVILFASKLLPRKRARDLWAAYVRLSEDGVLEPRPYLLIVGDGEERRPLEAEVAARGWRSVRFVGFQNQTSLPRYYDLCDVFVLPSEAEPWGLAVNEVMNAGRPVIVSDQVGAGHDLVIEGQTGYRFQVGDIATLSDRLRTLTEDFARVARMGAAGRRHISNWNFDRDVQGLCTALTFVLAQAKLPGAQTFATR
jgi:glycosyltransferase involved in cell wall biosynthesis